MTTRAELVERFKRMVADTEQREPVADDFAQWFADGFNARCPNCGEDGELSPCPCTIDPCPLVFVCHGCAHAIRRNIARRADAETKTPLSAENENAAGEVGP